MHWILAASCCFLSSVPKKLPAEQRKGWLNPLCISYTCCAQCRGADERRTALSDPAPLASNSLFLICLLSSRSGVKHCMQLHKSYIGAVAAVLQHLVCLQEQKKKKKCKGHFMHSLVVFVKAAFSNLLPLFFFFLSPFLLPNPHKLCNTHTDTEQ